MQFLTGLLWGSLSDRIGRKPVLLIGLLGTFASVNAFGLSRSFNQMIAARALNGLMNGNVAVIRSALGELTDETVSSAFARSHRAVLTRCIPAESSAVSRGQLGRCGRD